MKLVKFKQFKKKKWFWIGQYDPFQTIIDKFYFVFKEFCCLWVSTNLKRVMDALWLYIVGTQPIKFQYFLIVKSVATNPLKITFL